MKGKCLSGVKNLFHKKLILLYVVIFVVSTLFLLNGYSRVRSHGIDDCLACHEDKGLTMDRNGKKISLYVNANDFKKKQIVFLFTKV